MIVIRIGRQTLAFLGIALALAIGFIVGSAHPADFVLAAGRSVPAPASVAAAPMGQGAATLTLEQATRAVQGSVAYAQENGYRMSFVILDPSGTLVAAMKMDGSLHVTSSIAQGKAMASNAFRRSTGAIDEAFSANPVFWQSVLGSGRGFILSRGALPIVIDGVQVGAMAGSGGTGQQDEDAARAGLRAAGLE